MAHPDPIRFLMAWKKPVIMPIMDGIGGDLHVVVTKKNLIAMIRDHDLDVEFRTGPPLLVFLKRKRGGG